MSSSLAIRGRLSRRLVISKGNWLCWVVTTSFLDMGCEDFPGFRGLFSLGTGACLGPIVTLGTDFVVLPFLLVVVTSFHIGVSLTGPGVGWGISGSVALTTQSPRTMDPTRYQTLLLVRQLFYK